jgi:superfamily II DNA/RNA helicase
METEGIISKIANQGSISIDESFSFAKTTSVLLRNNEEEGRKIIIYILDNWSKIPSETIEIWTDLIESAGFYPYLEKEKERLKFDNLAGQIRKESHFSENLDGKYFHEEQKYLKKILDSKKNLIVSAPTSFGKSLLIEEIVASSKFKNILVIQPTLALLDETRKKLKKYKENYKIIVRTSQQSLEEKGNLFLLTAERVMEYPNLPQIDFFVIDEFYKLSAKRDDERSDVLNNAFYKLLQQTPVPQFYLLGPNIDGISEGFEEKYKAIFYKTNYSLVENKTIDIYSKNKTEFDQPRKFKEFKENKLFELLLDLKDEQTIIYCSSPNRVRYLADKFTKFLEEKNIQKIEKLPLVEWIEENINPKWNLINFLNFEIGINDGALQKHINSSMIDYFNEEKLKYIFCTSTIIEGVNTSAKNIIYFDKKKGLNDIDYFDYSNIKGRSGRMMIHYIGKIYNFNAEPEREEEMIIDIPFFEQNPVKKEIVNGMKDEDLKQTTKDSSEYKELLKIPTEERRLFQKNGVSIDGQKRILDQLKLDIETKIDLIKWNTSPNYRQLTYILSLAWKYLLKDGETARPMTLGNLIRVTNFYGIEQSIYWLFNDGLQKYKLNRDWINENKEKIELILNGLTVRKDKDEYKTNDNNFFFYWILLKKWNIYNHVIFSFRFQIKIINFTNIMNHHPSRATLYICIIKIIYLVWTFFLIKINYIFRLFQKNGVSIDGQKRILDQLKLDIETKIDLIKWNTSPNYRQYRHLNHPL